MAAPSPTLRRPAVSGGGCRRPGRPLVTFLARATAAAGGRGAAATRRVRRRARCGGSRCPRSGSSARPCTAAGPAPGSATARCSGWGSCCRCCAGPASTSARCRGWRSRAPRRCSSGPRAPGWPRCRGCAARPVWAAAVWVGAEALRARMPVRRLPVGARRVRPARRAAAAAWPPSAGRRCCRSSRRWPGSRSARPARRLARREVRAAVAPALVALVALAAGPLAALLPPAARRRSAP